MNAIRRLIIIVLAATASMALVSLVRAQGFPDYKTNNEWKPTDVEFQQLPAYCQLQFRPQLFGPDQTRAIAAQTAGCGPNFNHFCPGLVAVNRAANPSGSKAQRSQILGIAEQTLRGVLEKMSPSCPIAQDVRFAEQRTRLLRITVK